LYGLVCRAQRSMRAEITRGSELVSAQDKRGALPTRNRSAPEGVGPGSAVHRGALHRARGTFRL
jgi:hypothetical protein